MVSFTEPPLVLLLLVVLLIVSMQSHHMAESLEERASLKLISRDETIEGLRKEVNCSTTEKKRLEEEVEVLHAAKRDVDELKAKAESLDKALAASKTSEGLALERAWKANNTTENLRKEIDTEKDSSAALLMEVELLKKQLEEAKTLGLAAADAYSSALAGFGGITSSMPPEASPFGIFSWMGANFSKLPEFVGKVGDFAALSSATNLAKVLAKAGCEHVAELKRRKEFESTAGLGDAPKAVSKAVKNFISYFWCKFG